MAADDKTKNKNSSNDSKNDRGADIAQGLLNSKFEGTGYTPEKKGPSRPSVSASKIRTGSSTASTGSSTTGTSASQTNSAVPKTATPEKKDPSRPSVSASKIRTGSKEDYQDYLKTYLNKDGSNREQVRDGFKRRYKLTDIPSDWGDSTSTTSSTAQPNTTIQAKVQPAATQTTKTSLTSQSTSGNAYSASKWESTNVPEFKGAYEPTNKEEIQTPLAPKTESKQPAKTQAAASQSTDQTIGVQRPATGTHLQGISVTNGTEKVEMPKVTSVKMTQPVTETPADDAPVSQEWQDSAYTINASENLIGKGKAEMKGQPKDSPKPKPERADASESATGTVATMDNSETTVTDTSTTGTESDTITDATTTPGATGTIADSTTTPGTTTTSGTDDISSEYEIDEDGITYQKATPFTEPAPKLSDYERNVKEASLAPYWKKYEEDAADRENRLRKANAVSSIAHMSNVFAALANLVKARNGNLSATIPTVNTSTLISQWHDKQLARDKEAYTMQKAAKDADYKDYLTDYQRWQKLRDQAQKHNQSITDAYVKAKNAAKAKEQAQEDKKESIRLQGEESRKTKQTQGASSAGSRTTTPKDGVDNMTKQQVVDAYNAGVKDGTVQQIRKGKRIDSNPSDAAMRQALRQSRSGGTSGTTGGNSGNKTTTNVSSMFNQKK